MPCKNLFIFVTDPVKGKRGKLKDSRCSCYLANGIVIFWRINGALSDSVEGQRSSQLAFGCFSELMLVWLNSL